MSEQNPKRVVVNDALEREQLKKTQQTIEEQRKATLQKKYQKTQMKKYNVFRFSNWLLWITIVLLIIVGVIVYNKFMYLGTDYWGKDGGYSRVADRGQLNQSALDKVNKTYELKDGRSAKFEQKGPTVNLLIYVPEGTKVTTAKQFADEVISAFLTELGDAKTAEAPYGKTFMNYELSVIVTQTNLPKPDDATLNQIGDPNGVANKIGYPFFGTVRKGVMTWTNNVA